MATDCDDYQSEQDNDIEYEPFPVDYFPDKLCEYVTGVSDTFCCDSAVVAIPMLGIIAGMVGNRRKVRLKQLWVEPAAIWALVVSEPSAENVRAFNCVTKYLKYANENLHDEYLFDSVKYDRDLANWREGKVGVDRPIEPAQKYWSIGGMSYVEMLRTLRSEMDRALIVQSDLTRWFDLLFNINNFDYTVDYENWFDLWQVTALNIHRSVVGGRGLYIEEAICSIAGMVNSFNFNRNVMSELYFGKGLSRFLFASPPSAKIRKWNDGDCMSDEEKAWDDTLCNVSNIVGVRTLELDEDAKSVWAGFYNKVENVKFSLQDQKRLVDRIQSYGARLALIHHLISTPIDDDGPIKENSMEAGALLAEWFANEARRNYIIANSAIEDTREDF